MLLNTGQAAWAEVGFTGGGYLRLNENSELSILAIERTSSGREVLLKLSRGTAWNVVEKGQGGYRIDTPVVSTAVRGTIFRVDAGGLIKVIDGKVGLLSQQDAEVKQGEQRSATGEVGKLQLDAIDLFNQSLDQERLKPLQLDLQMPKITNQPLILKAKSSSDAVVRGRILNDSIDLEGILAFDTATGFFEFKPDSKIIPDGKYAIQVISKLRNSTEIRDQYIILDRTAPKIDYLKISTLGQVLVIQGTVKEGSNLNVHFSINTNGNYYTRILTHLGYTFKWVLPYTKNSNAIQLKIHDEAGNENNVQIP